MGLFVDNASLPLQYHSITNEIKVFLLHGSKKEGSLVRAKSFTTNMLA